MDIKRVDRLLFVTALILAALLLIRVIAGKAAGPETVTLTAAEWRETESGESDLLPLIAAFEKENPGLKILVTRQSRGETEALLRNAENAEAAKDRSPPDIVILDDPLLRAGVSGETLAETGGAWAVPLESHAVFLFYNIDLLKAAGLDRPPGNRDEFFAAARAAAQRPGVSGAALSLGPGDPSAVFRDIFTWIWAAGERVTDDFSGPQIADTLDFLARLSAEGLLAPRIFETTGAERLLEFSKGTIAFLIGAEDAIPFLRKEMGASFGLTVIPAPASYTGRPVCAFTRRYAGILRRGARLEEARAFLAFLAARRAPSPRPAPDDPLAAKIADIRDASDLAEDYLQVSEAREAALREELPGLLSGRTTGADAAARVNVR
jgi:multiple sugar transport system substrate-binding protein